MMRLFVRSVALLAVVLLAVGCQRQLHYEKTIALEPGEVQAILIDEPKSAKQLTVVVDAGTTPVNVYVARDKDQGSVKQKLLDQQKPPADLLATRPRVTKETIEVTKPAGEGFAVLLTADKKADVKVKITGK